MTIDDHARARAANPPPAEAPAARPRMGVALIGVLIAITAINALAISIVVPALPSIRRDLGVGIAEAQLVLSGYLVALAAGHLFVGLLADRFGRRPVLVGGTAIFALSGVAAAFAPSNDVLVILRIAQGLGGSVGMVVSRAAVRDLFDRDSAASVIGYLTMGLAVAPMVGPLIGGLTDDAFGWRAIFLGLAAAAVAATAVAWLVMPETGVRHANATVQTLVADIRALLAAPAFWTYTATMALISGTYFSFLGGAPFVATELIGLSATELGAFLLFVSAGYFVGNFVSGRFAQTVGVHAMINTGNAVVTGAVAMMVAMFAVGWLSAWTLFLPMFLVGFGNGVSLPSATAGAISVRPEVAGTASGLSGTAQFAVGSVAIAAAGWALAAAPSAITVAAIMLAFAGAAGAIGLLTRKARS